MGIFKKSYYGSSKIKKSDSIIDKAKATTKSAIKKVKYKQSGMKRRKGKRQL